MVADLSFPFFSPLAAASVKVSSRKGEQGKAKTKQSNPSPTVPLSVAGIHCKMFSLVPSNYQYQFTKCLS